MRTSRRAVRYRVPFVLLALVAITSGARSPLRAPEPANGYLDAIARAERRQADDDRVVAAGGRSLLFVHGDRTPRAVVLLHGFTDSPRQFEALGTLLYETGDNVYVPRLPHHAEREGKVAELASVNARELRAFADSVIDVAAGLGDTVVVVGLSAGGTVAAWIAQHHSDVSRVVLVAPAIGIGRVPDDLALPLIAVAARLPNVTRQSEPDSTRPDFVQGLTTHGLAQVFQLGARVRRESKQQQASTPSIAFLLNERDHTVSEDAALDLATQWAARGASVSLFRFPSSVGLAHNVMEPVTRGGHPDIVHPVLIALAHGESPPSDVRTRAARCHLVGCATRKWDALSP